MIWRGLISCLGKHRSHQRNVSHRQVSGPMPLVVLHHTCCNSRQGTLEVDKVGNRVPSQRTRCLLLFSPARQVTTCRHNQMLFFIPHAPFFVSQSVCSRRKQTSVFGNPPRVADPIKLWLPPWHLPTCMRRGFYIRKETT